MRREIRIGLCVLAHPLEVGKDRAGLLLEQASDLLRENPQLRPEIVPAPVDDLRRAAEAGERLARADADAIILLLATWSDDALALRIQEATGRPVILWAVPGIHTGSLCGCQQINACMKEMGLPSWFFYGEIGEPRTKAELPALVRAASLRRRLGRTRIGLLGRRTQGMLETASDEFGIRQTFGAEIIQEERGAFLRRAMARDPALLRESWDSIKAKVGSVQVPEDSIWDALKVYKAFEEFMDRRDLSGVTVDCYPDALGVFCLTASLLSEAGRVVACEADVHAALASLVAADFSQGPVHNTDLLHVYPEEQSALFSHCGAGAFSLASRREEICLAPVRLAEKGCCVHFPGRAGPVTLTNLIGRSGTYRMCILEGEAVPGEMVFPGNPVRVGLPVSVDDFLEEVAAKGFGHHWVIGYGKFGRTLAKFCRHIDIQARLLKKDI